MNLTRKVVQSKEIKFRRKIFENFGFTGKVKLVGKILGRSGVWVVWRVAQIWPRGKNDAPFLRVKI